MNSYASLDLHFRENPTQTELLRLPSCGGHTATFVDSYLCDVRIRSSEYLRFKFDWLSSADHFFNELHKTVTQMLTEMRASFKDFYMLHLSPSFF